MVWSVGKVRFEVRFEVRFSGEATASPDCRALQAAGALAPWDVRSSTEKVGIRMSIALENLERGVLTEWTYVIHPWHGEFRSRLRRQAALSQRIHLRIPKASLWRLRSSMENEEWMIGLLPSGRHCRHPGTSQVVRVTTYNMSIPLPQPVWLASHNRPGSAGPCLAN